MTTLLFPSRHLLHTTFQIAYLRAIVQIPLQRLPFLDGHIPPSARDEKIDRIIFAITSSNQAHSRYSPLPFHFRAIGVDRLAKQFESSLRISYAIYGVPHYAPTDHFAAILIKEIHEQSEQAETLHPNACVVLSSTPELMFQFRKLGYAILPAEYAHVANPDTPLSLLQKIVDVDNTWQTSTKVRSAMSATTFNLWQDFPAIPRRIFRLWRDPLLTVEGNLTDTRDYHIYAVGMGGDAILRKKYGDIKQAILPGKIVDEGCADGALLALIAADFPDSDLIGIEITGEFIARCLERQRQGHFGGNFVHFHQRNLLNPIFSPGSIQTTICNSTIHELWSYGNREATVISYLADKYAQLARGGRLLIRDVVGPPDKEKLVLLWLNRQDGANEYSSENFASAQELAQHLTLLSTYARFLHFANDFLADKRASGAVGRETIVEYEEVSIDNELYVRISLRWATEFMTKKDYVNNWRSEMNEEFAFWSYEEWKSALAHAGFRIIEDPNSPDFGSRVYTNSWIIDNRYRGRVALFDEKDGELTKLAFPVTTVVLVAEKPDIIL